jgi:hypothetical protein
MLCALHHESQTTLTHDPGNTPGTAAPAGNTAGARVHLLSAIESTNDVDLFSFQAVAGQALSAELLPQADGALQPRLTLYGPDGVTVLATSAETGRAALSAVPLSVGGVYYLAVTPADRLDPLVPASGTTSGSYSLSVLTGPPANLQPRITASTNRVDFGQVISANPLLQTLWVTNTSASFLMVTGLTCVNATGVVASFGPQPLPFKLAPGECRSLEVLLAPTTNGPLAGTIQVWCDGQDRPLATVAVSAAVALRPAFLAPCLVPGEGWQAFIGGEVGGTYRVRRSIDLLHWELVTNLVSTQPLTLFWDGTVSNHPHVFYSLGSP